jgi:hypothetical protein
MSGTQYCMIIDLPEGGQLLVRVSIPTEGDARFELDRRATSIDVWRPIGHRWDGWRWEARVEPY